MFVHFLPDPGRNWLRNCLSVIPMAMPEVGRHLRSSILGPQSASLSSPTRYALPSLTSFKSVGTAWEQTANPRDWALSLLEKESPCLFTEAHWFCIQRQSSRQGLVRRRVRAARSKGGGLSVVTCSPSPVRSIFGLLIVALPFMCLPCTRGTLPGSFTNWLWKC